MLLGGGGYLLDLYNFSTLQTGLENSEKFLLTYVFKYDILVIDKKRSFLEPENSETSLNRDRKFSEILVDFISSI